MTHKRVFKTLMASTALGVALMAATPASADTLQDLEQQVQTLTRMLNQAIGEINTLKAQQNQQNQQIASQQQQIQQTQESQQKASDSGFSIKWEPAPSIKSNDGRFEVNLRGRVMADAGWVSNDDTADVKATELRRARLGIEGKAWNNVKYKFEVDFAGNEVDITDAYVQPKFGDFKITIGQHKTPVSLEEQTSSRYITFMERAAFTDAFDFARQIGVSIGTGGNNWTIALGAFRGDAGSSDMDEGTTLAARATYGPKIGEKTQAHLGVSTRYRQVGDDQDLIRYRQRPFSHVTSERFVATSRMFDEDLFLGFEAALVHGPFSVQGEYGMQWANLPGNSDDASFHGYYVGASYFLTGESRNYDAGGGDFGRVKPRNPVFQGGWGAWEVGYRYDVVDLTDMVDLDGGGTLDIFGGKQRTHIVGINWHWNPYMRMMFNYSRSRVTDAFDVALNGADGRNSIDTFGVRAQVDW